MPFLRMTRALIQFAWGCNSLDIAHGLNGIETSLADPGDMIRVPRSITDAVERAVHVAVTLKELNAGSTVGSAPGGPPQRLNPEQRMAVAAVVTGACGDIPFALCGPPGTGKTLTLVETALQILER